MFYKNLVIISGEDMRIEAELALHRNWYPPSMVEFEIYPHGLHRDICALHLRGDYLIKDHNPINGFVVKNILQQGKPYNSNPNIPLLVRYYFLDIDHILSLLLCLTMIHNPIVVSKLH